MAAMTREAEDLKSTIKVLEKKRQEDREKLKLLERVQGERDKFEIIIQKLQGISSLDNLRWGVGENMPAH
jgi:dynactin 1